MSDVLERQEERGAGRALGVSDVLEGGIHSVHESGTESHGLIRKSGFKIPKQLNGAV